MPIGRCLLQTDLNIQQYQDRISAECEKYTKRDLAKENSLPFSGEASKPLELLFRLIIEQKTAHQ